MPCRSILTLALVAGVSSTMHAESLLIHEWGTFTSLQDDNGKAIGRINVDDEPVPAFVHDAIPGELDTLSDRPVVLGKGWTIGDPDVTMRLETPVLYVHPGNGSPEKFDVHVAFHGGWLTQFYPQAAASIPGSTDAHGNIFRPPITSASIGSLQWTGVSTATSAAQEPKTDVTVWTAPRQVDSATLTVGGEAEKFLFYRGVGHLDAPVSVIRDQSGLLRIQRCVDALDIKQYWLVDIHDDGTMAFRRIDQTGATSPLVVGPDTFAPAQYAATRRSALKAELLESLIADGLFQDEAEAMLATWEASYFHGVGLRLFFLAPHAWTDRVLPLAVSVPATITRVMVGRIDLLSTQQRAQLATIARSKTSTLTWWLDFLNSRVYAPTVAGKTVYRPGGRELLDRIVSETGTLAHLGVAIPPDYAAYLALGRFRQALMFHALEEHPAPAVKKFAMIYGLTSPFFPIQ